MAWPLKERRGPAWKQGWTINTLSSISAPPLQLLSIAGIVMFLLFVPSYINFKSTVQTATVGFHLLLLFLPLLLIFIAYFVSRCGTRLVLPVPLWLLFGRRARREEAAGGSSSPWGVAALVVLLLVLASYLSNCRSMWSPLISRPY